jgi:hypothetical protein
MRASLAVALCDYNDRAIRWKMRSTIFTKPSGAVIVAAVVFKFHLSLLQKVVCAIVAAPLLCVEAEDAAHQKSQRRSRPAEHLMLMLPNVSQSWRWQCVHKEYPNKISHVLNSDADVAPPRQTDTRVLRLLRLALVSARTLAAGAAIAHVSRRAIRKSRARRFEESLTAENLKAEAAYLRGEGRASFERPYGLAWLLQLCAELREWDDPQAREMLANLKPLEDAAIERLTRGYRNSRTQYASVSTIKPRFALGLLLDCARVKNDERLAKLAADSARKFYLTDKNCPLAYEPSGEDFLSPCLGEADVMRRVLTQTEFAKWLAQFLPQIPRTATGIGCPVAISPIRAIQSWRISMD